MTWPNMTWFDLTWSIIDSLTWPGWSPYKPTWRRRAPVKNPKTRHALRKPDPAPISYHLTTTNRPEYVIALIQINYLHLARRGEFVTRPRPTRTFTPNQSLPKAARRRPAAASPCGARPWFQVRARPARSTAETSEFPSTAKNSSLP